ncbi:MAG: alpha/beta fold hydrolase [Candidatus Micrarchaeota archaeon]
MKLFLFHCWGGDGRSCWSGWTADKMREMGADVIAPDFPNSSTPHIEEWLATARSHVKKFDDGWVLAGHSLGCPTILRLLEGFENGERVKAAILVAGFAKDLHIPELQNFVYKDFDWEKIRAGAEKFIVISSDNDPFIELSEGERVAKMLGAEFIVERGAGHINEGSGFTEYPRLLSILERLM